jgi:lipopolysaccharide/colanic/teichoic acid biosynthesis glycosyltransferase
MSHTVLTLPGGLAQVRKAVKHARFSSPERLRKSISLERARADRSHYEFSLLTLRIPESARRRPVEAIVSQWLDDFGDQLDQFGWLRSDRLAILLPAASAEKAAAMARSILGAVTAAFRGSWRSIEWRVDTYPGDGRKQRRQWQSFDCSGRESGYENGNCADAEPVSALVGVHSATLANGPAEAVACERRPASVATYIQRLDIRPCPWWKRAMDIVGAAAGMVALAPLMLFVAVYIKCVSRGPVFFRQRRYGLAGRPFKMWKFRTIETSQSHEDRQQSHVAELMQNDRPLQKRDLSSCIIPGGGVLRRFGIDELPQLINVLRGEMSLVGPRPDVIPFGSYEVWHRRRFDVAPGITGLWQVNGKNLTTFNTMIRLDIAYVRRRSFLLDVSILLRTVWAVLRN